MMAQPGQILIPGEDLRSNLSDDELNRIMGCLPSSVVNEKNEGTGSFRAYLIDYLYKTNAESLINESNIRIL